MARISAGSAQLNTHKAEDAYVKLQADAPAKKFAAAVFDGHGGRAAAEACKEGVVERLLRSSAPLDADDFLDSAANAFWDTDDALGQHGDCACAGLDPGTCALPCHP